MLDLLSKWFSMLSGTHTVVHVCYSVWRWRRPRRAPAPRVPIARRLLGAIKGLGRPLGYAGAALMYAAIWVVGSVLPDTEAPRYRITLFEHDVPTANDLLFLRSLVTNDPSNAPAHRSLGRAYMRLGDATLARGELEKAADLAPLDPKNHIYLGEFLEHSGDSRRARTEYENAIAVDPEYPYAYTSMAMLDVRSGALEHASVMVRKAEQLISGSPYVESTKAHVLEAKGAHRRAVEAMKKAVDADPGFAGYYADIVPMLARDGRLREALEYAETAVRMDPDDYGNHTTKGAVLANLGRYGEAISTLREAAKIAPQAREPRVLLAECYADLGRYASAIRECIGAMRCPGYTGRELIVSGLDNGVIGGFARSVKGRQASLQIVSISLFAAATLLWVGLSLGSLRSGLRALRARHGGAAGQSAGGEAPSGDKATERADTRRRARTQKPKRGGKTGGHRSC